jgi:polygalacturonase
MRVHILLGLLSTCSAARHDVSGCINISTPSANYSANTATLQAALDSASATKGCVVVSGGDYPVAPGLFVGSDTHLRLEAGSRLVNVVNVTRTAVVHVRNAQRVLLDGGGTLYGDAEHAWSFFSADDDRMSPYIDDGNTLRTNLLRIEGSAGVEVRGTLARDFVLSRLATTHSFSTRFHHSPSLLGVIKSTRYTGCGCTTPRTGRCAWTTAPTCGWRAWTSTATRASRTTTASTRSPAAT